jgi:NAD(P)H-hydrate epimerase
MRVVTAPQMRAIDAAAVARDGEVALMRAAGAAIARLIDRYGRGDGPVIALAGNGNNGGDAYAALAAYSGARMCIVYADPTIAGSAARRDARANALAAGVEERALPLPYDALTAAGLVLDGVLGANARLPLDDASGALADAMRTCGAPILALDITTGVEPTSGAVDPRAPAAAATIALGRPKLGSFLDPGRDHTGELWCAPLGMHDDDAAGIDGVPLRVLDPLAFAALLPPRGAESDKRASGAPLIIAGSTQFPGAAVLCALGAARAGAGYVTVAAPEGAAAALRAHLIEQVVVTYDERDPAGALRTILGLTGRCTSIAMGPGLGLSDVFREIVLGVIDAAAVPMVIDASALFHLAKQLERMKGKPIVVTPHDGEFARLSGKGTIAPGTRLERLREFVDRTAVTTLLKGRTTLIGSPNATWCNPTGTNALATAGTGDVLSGVIATLLAQGLAPLDAARAGAYWHGRAGIVAARRRPRGVIAGDVADALGEASLIPATDPGLLPLFGQPDDVEPGKGM